MMKYVQTGFSGKFLLFSKTVLVIIFTGAMSCAGAEAQSGNAAALRAQYDSLKPQLQRNQFNRPLVLDSKEAPGQLKGNIYAVIDHSFDEVRTGLNNPDHWCDVLLLHLNTKYCRAQSTQAGAILNVHIGKKKAEEITDSTPIEFQYKLAAITPDYFEINLNAKEGPMGTSDYRIMLEAVTLEKSKTFIHLTYSYSTSMTGRFAMKTYLATAGSDKVGFTVVGKQADGKPAYIGGVRGIIERNTMRYYLAIDAFLSAANAAPEVQLEKRLQTWFSATEQYHRQLHEMERNDYLDMKHVENARQLSMR